MRISIITSVAVTNCACAIVQPLGFMGLRRSRESSLVAARRRLGVAQGMDLVGPSCRTSRRFAVGVLGSRADTPLRSDRRVLGREGLEGQARVAAHRDSTILQADVAFAFCCRHMRLPGGIAAESSSRLWVAPHMLRMLRADSLQESSCHLCRWGSRWRRSVRFVAFGADLGLLHRRCRATAKQACQASGRPHLSAADCAEQGVPWGAVAATLRVELTRAVVSAYRDGLVATRARALMRYMTAASQATS